MPGFCRKWRAGTGTAWIWRKLCTEC
jgi:hypothetical protein